MAGANRVNQTRFTVQKKRCGFQPEFHSKYARVRVECLGNYANDGRFTDDPLAAGKYRNCCLQVDREMSSEMNVTRP
jgi:hypothetical protein